MSTNLRLAVEGNLLKTLEADIREAKTVARKTLSDLAEGVKVELRSQLRSAGLAKLEKTWQQKVFINKPPEGFNMAAVVSNKAPRIIDPFARGAIISGSGGRKLALPTKEARNSWSYKYGRQNKKLTPDNWIKRFGGEFTVVKIPGSTAVMLAWRSSSELAKQHVKRRGRRPKKQKPWVFLFLLVPQVRIAKRLDVDGVAKRAHEKLTAINMLANAAGGFVQPSGPGIYEMGQLVEPGGTAAVTFREAGVKVKLGVNDADIVKIRPVVSNDEGRGVAAWQITLGYAKNWTVQSSFAGATTAEEQERYRGEVLKVTSAVPSVLTKYPQAPVITLDTLLTEQADAADECARRADLYCAERAMYEIEAQFTISLAQNLKKGARVKVFARRYGLTDGRDFIVTQFELNARTGRVIATLWG